MSEPEGITNHPASTETAENAKLKTPPPPDDKAPEIETGDLRKGMAEKAETVNVNTMDVSE